MRVGSEYRRREGLRMAMALPGGGLAGGGAGKSFTGSGRQRFSLVGSSLGGSHLVVGGYGYVITLEYVVSERL